MHNLSSPDMGRRILPAALGFTALFSVTAAAAWRLDVPPLELLAASAVLGLALAILSAIDVYTFRLPDLLTLPLLAAGLAVAWALDLGPLWWRGLSALIGWGLLAGIAALYERARGKSGLGLGDAKLLAAGAAWVGAEGIPTTLLVAAFSALALVAGARLAGRTITGTTRLPFGPFLALGIWLVWLVGPI